MEDRKISEREFVNYYRGVGGYCTYSDAVEALKGALKTLLDFFGIQFEQLKMVLPEAVFGLIEQDLMTEIPAVLDFLAEKKLDERAITTLFGSVKEKCASSCQQWLKLIATGRNSNVLKELWERSHTIDQQQDAGQCL